jgi:hypothetical protein
VRLGVQAPITPGEQSHRRESCRTGVLGCTSNRRYERREMVEPRAWGNFMIRRQRVIEEVFMPRQAASRAPKLADVDKPRAVRRLNTCGMRSLSPEVYHSTSRDGKTNRHGFAKADTVGKLLWFLLLSSARIRNQRASPSSNEKQEKEDDTSPAT